MKRIMKITLILVIPSFIVLYGWSSMSRTSRGGGWYYIKIKESPLQLLRWSSVSEWEMKQAKENLLSEYQALLGIQNREMASQVEKLITPDSVASRAIKNRLLIKQANDKSIYASLPELRSFIEQIHPQNPQMALQYLMRMQGYTDENSFIRDQLYRITLEKSRSLFATQAKASLFELWQQYLLMEEKLEMIYVLFNATDYQDKITLSDENTRQYFEEHKEDYRIPDQVQYEYLAVNKNTLINEVETTDTQVLAYYEENRETEFKVDRQVMVRQIMRSFPPNTPEEQLAGLKQLMDDLYTSITVRQADFAELADRFSNDPANTTAELDDERNPTGKQIKKGGLSGTYWTLKDAQRLRYGQNVIEQALSMEEGDISEPIRGENSFHILKIEEVRPERIMTFEDARSQAEFSLKRKKGEAIFEEKRKLIYEKFDQVSTLSGLARELGLPIRQTGLVNKDTTFFPEIGGLSRFRNLLMSLQENETSDLLETPNLLAILRVKKRVPSHIPDFEDIQEKVEKDTTLFKGLQMAKKDAEALQNKSGSAQELKNMAEENEYEIVTPEPFPHASPPAELGDIKNLAQTTIRTPVETVVLSEVVQRGMREKSTGYAVWSILEKIPPAREQFIKDLPGLQRDYIQGKQRTIINENLRDLAENVRFEVNPQFLGIE